MIYLSIVNVFAIFTLDTEILPSSMLANLGGDSVQIRYYLYTFILFLGPLCTATALWKVLGRFFTLGINKIKYSNYEPVIVFGYNEYVKALIENEQNKNKKIVFHIFSNEEMSKEQETRLSKKKVMVHFGEYSKITKEEIEVIRNSINIEKLRKILLFEGSDSQNISRYIALSEEQKFNSRHVAFYIFIQNQQMQSLLEDYHDFNKKNKDINKRIHIVNVEELMLQDLFSNDKIATPIYKKNFAEIDRATKSTVKLLTPDVHVLLVGWDRLSQQMFRHVLNEGVLSKESSISIDVVQVETGSQFGKKVLLDSLADKYDQFEKINKDIDGEVFVEFYETEHFETKLIEELESANPFTYILISTGDTKKNLSYLFMLNDYFLKKQAKNVCSFDTPIVTVLDEGMDTSIYLHEDVGTYKNISIMKSEKEIWDIDCICNYALEKKEMEYNHLYNILYNDINGNPDSATYDELIKEWEELSYFYKQSNRFACYHDDVKKRLLSSAANDESVRQKISENEDWLALEHRRWCYYEILNGWSSGEEKLSVIKENPMIRKFDDLNEGKELNKIPYLVMLQSRENS